MINIKVGISFGVVFNDTERDWHELQHKLGSWVEGQVLHCLPKTFSKEPSFSINCINFVVDYHVKLNGLSIECICIQRDSVSVTEDGE